MKKLVVLFLSMLCVSSAVFAAASDESGSEGSGGRRRRRHKKHSEVAGPPGAAPTVAKFIVGALCNDMGASHRVEWITPYGASHFVPTGQVVHIDEDIPFDAEFDPKNITGKDISASQRIVKGDHSYIIKYYTEGIWIFRVKDCGATSKRDCKKLASLGVLNAQKLDLAFVHPDVKEKKKTAAIITLALGEHAKMVEAKAASSTKRGSLTSIVRRGRSSSSVLASASSSKK